MAQNTPMTEAMYYLLLALTRPAHGYRLMQQVNEASGGRVSMGPGTLYGLLSKMEKDGMIQLQQQDERRKIYALTPLGRNVLKQEFERLQMLVNDGKKAQVEQL